MLELAQHSRKVIACGPNYIEEFRSIQEIGISMDTRAKEDRRVNLEFYF